MTPKLNSRTVGKIKAAYPESEAIAELATQVARLERAVREAEDIGNAACRESEARAEAAERALSEVADKLDARADDHMRGAMRASSQQDPWQRRIQHDIETAFREAARLVRGSISVPSPENLDKEGNDATD